MFKRALSCVAACVVLLGCSVDEAAEQQEFNAPTSLFDPVGLVTGAVPFPVDAFFAGTTDPTLNIPNSSGAPFVDAANELDGFSTVAPVFTDLLGFIDLDTANGGAVIVLNTATGTPLVPGTDFVVQGYPAIDDADGIPINEKRTRLLIQWLRPLQPETRYVVAVTRELRDVDGQPAEPAAQFLVAASDTPVSEQTAPILAAMNDTQRATLEAIRSQVIQPTVAGLGAAGIPAEALVIAWPFTTQSIGKSLASIRDNIALTPLGVQNTGATTSALGLPAGADIYAGTLEVNYYQQVPTMDNPTAPLTSFWQADPDQVDASASFLGTPCPAFTMGSPQAQPSASRAARGRALRTRRREPGPGPCKSRGST